MDREVLAGLAAEGLTVRAIAEQFGVSHATVRYWMDKYGVRTGRGRRLDETKSARAAKAADVVAHCSIHGMTRLVPRPSGGYRCLACRNAAVSDRRRRVKAQLVAEAGGRCASCGYDRTPAALQFHHVDPATKSFSISGTGVTRSLARARAEAAKCILLCANCHAEVEVGIRQVVLPRGNVST